MFTLDNVTLRPPELEDIDALYRWHSDFRLEIASGWTRRLSSAAFRQKYEQRIMEPRSDLELLMIVTPEGSVGYLQLALIDREERRAAVGVVIGEREVWGRGIGTTAVRLLLDYAFTAKGLERIFAECYGFNTRAHRLFECIGFQREGILRQHEFHSGARQDLHIFGILKPEFYARYETIFQL